MDAICQHRKMAMGKGLEAAPAKTKPSYKSGGAVKSMPSKSSKGSIKGSKGSSCKW